MRRTGPSEQDEIPFDLLRMYRRALAKAGRSVRRRSPTGNRSTSPGRLSAGAARKTPVSVPLSCRLPPTS